MKTMKKRNIPIIVTGTALLLLFVTGLLYILWYMGAWEKQIDIKTYTFTESSRELKNPNCGFYYIYGFRITDQQEDYRKLVAEKYANDEDTVLTQIQINLQEYRGGDITRAGLSNIEALFSALQTIDKQLIVRFLYDVEGKGQEHEPEKLETILRHIEQLKPVLHRYSKQIFTLQGLFIGNWGEMNGSNYQSAPEMCRLAKTLAKATDEETYLSVRMPAQWRTIASAANWQEESLTADEIARVGLFNDGMLGSESDYGTYGTKNQEDSEAYTLPWNRENELVFQEELCCSVPNGGEVIHENPYNDLDNAIKDFSSMHISYINEDYDRTVFEKWAKETITGEGCFSGMDGLTYMERHLGYRLLITNVEVKYKLADGYLSTGITFKNIGFAPLYRDAEVELSIYNKETGHLLTYEVPQNLRKLSGGTQAEETLTISKSIPVSEFREKQYDLYVSITDSRTGKPISLANEQEVAQYGYKLATVTLE